MVNCAHKKNKCVLCPFWTPGLKNCAYHVLKHNPKEPVQWIDGIKEEIENEMRPLGETMQQEGKEK